MSLKQLAVAIGICVSASGLPAQTTPSVPADSARRLVQHFYDWYVPRAADAHGRDVVMLAAAHGPLPFDAELVHWLRVDSTAQARAKGEIDGLDADPYLNAQDPCDRYSVRAVAPHGASFYVSVLGTGGCADHTRPDVIVEIARRGTRWTIVEFRDPRRDDQGLIPLLRLLHPKAK